MGNRNFVSVLICFTLFGFTICVDKNSGLIHTVESDGSEGVVGNLSTLRPGFLPLPPEYNKLVMPLGNIADSMYCFVSLAIREILDVDNINGIVEMDTEIRIEWIDWVIWDYLSKDESRRNEVEKWIPPDSPDEEITLDAKFLTHIWKPDIFIVEMASVERTSLLSELITLRYLLKNPVIPGAISYIARQTFKVRCDMKFQYYPADIQECPLHIRSYRNFSTLAFVLKVRRDLTYHLVQTCLPSILLVFITWLCFLLPPDMIEPRIGVSMTTLLTLTALFAAVRDQAPSVSYTMAIDMWMVFCIFFLFLALLIFTVLYWMRRKLQGVKDTGKEDELENGGGEAPLEKEQAEKFKRIAEHMMRYTFVIFAITFVIFLILFPLWLLSASNYLKWNPSEEYNVLPGSPDEKKLFAFQERDFLPSQTLKVVKSLYRFNRLHDNIIKPRLEEQLSEEVEEEVETTTTLVDTLITTMTPEMNVAGTLIVQ